MKKKNNKREFSAWVEQQFGPRVRGDSRSDEDLDDLIKAGEVASVELERRKAYDEARLTALLGWTAATLPAPSINRPRSSNEKS